LISFRKEVGDGETSFSIDLRTPELENGRICSGMQSDIADSDPNEKTRPLVWTEAKGTS
jgi:hypothetical protein